MKELILTPKYTIVPAKKNKNECGTAIKIIKMLEHDMKLSHTTPLTYFE